MKEAVKHLTRERLLAYDSNSLDRLQADEVEIHILECEACRELLPPPATQFLAALFEENEYRQQENFSPKSAPTLSWFPFSFLPFSNRRGSAWGTVAAVVLLLAGSGYFWLQKTGGEIAYQTTNTANTISSGTDTNAATVDKNSFDLIAKRESGSQDKEKGSLPAEEEAVEKRAEDLLPTRNSARASLLQQQSARHQIKNEKTREKIELAQLIEKTPAMVTALRSNRESVLRDNSGGGSRAEKTFELIGPVGETVNETAPEFRWEKAAEAANYRITIFDANFNEMVTTEVSGTSFKIGQSLTPGEKYLWRVAAQTTSGEIIAPRLPQPPAMFRIAPKNTESQIETLKKKKNGQFKAALLYAREGMLDASRCTLMQLLKKNPKHAAARSLLKKVEQWQRENQTGVQRCDTGFFRQPRVLYRRIRKGSLSFDFAA